MPYVTQADVLSLLSNTQLVDALNDDSSGDITSPVNAAVLPNIIAVCSRAVDAKLANIYTVPFPDPAPAKVRDATLIFVCEALLNRRLPPDVKNPFADRANDWRRELVKIGHGELELDQSFPRSFFQGNAILTQSRINGSTL
jgi:hypothetical protein